MRTEENDFLQSRVVRNLIRDVATRARYVVGIGQMPVAVHDAHNSRKLACQGIARVHAQHEVRREIRAPRPRVIEIVFCVQRVVADKAGEDSSLHRQPFPHGCQIRDIRRAEMT